MRRLTKSRQTTRIDYGSESDWIDLLSPFLTPRATMLTDEECEKLRRSQFAYLARYAPGARVGEHTSVYELRAWVASVSDIVREEQATAEGG